VRDVEEPSPHGISNPDDAAWLALEFVTAADDDCEHFWVVLLNIKHRYLMHTEVSIGTVKAVLVSPRGVFGPAVREGVSSILLCHNHPSGEPDPSAEDRELTRHLVECGKTLRLRFWIM
jgi:DNA repair protein RadC